MSKISELAAYALENNLDFKSGNTRVTNGEMYLHYYLIAKYENNRLYINLQGWNNTTTKRRLNALSGVSIKQKDFVLYLNGVIINDDVWIDVKGVK